MIKKSFLIASVAIFLNFCINSPSFAIEESKLQNKYPDYAYEFCGKDKCEKFNRKLFIFNLKLNKYVLRPVNIVWASVMPKYGIDRFKNAYNNINYPIRLMSCLFQKDFKSSGTETVRFLTNTTIGLGGLYDPAKKVFKIEPRQEDMGQVLTHYKVKKGPYLVLPVVHGNLRSLAGQLLDCAFKPFSYIPIAGGIVNAAFFVNNTTSMQPLIKKLETTYADPYEIVKQIDGIERYIKNSNLDRKEVLMEKTASQNIIEISNVSVNPDLKPDIKLNNYNPQTPLIDSMRTALFDNKDLGKSIWTETSVWNRNFKKKIKISSVRINSTRPKYNYRYILQKKKTSPVAIIFPSIGEGIMADKSTVLAKILYDEGYSVVIEGSPCNWEFVKSMPEGYKPGAPSQDAKYLRMVTSKILDKLQNKKSHKFSKKIIVGSSFGGLTTLFVAAQEENENTLDISHYISINPPIEIFFALKQLDKYCQDWKKDPSDIKLKAAITAEKVVQAVQNISDKKNTDNKCEPLSFTDDEAKLIVGFIMKQKLSDVIFAIENGSRSKKCNLYETINKMSFYDYAQKYLLVNQNKSLDQFDYETGLHSLTDFLQKSNKYKIYHSLDDYFVNTEQLVWLKTQSNGKSVFFSNGSHLGFMYRKEFIDEFKKEIKLTNTATPATQDKATTQDKGGGL